MNQQHTVLVTVCCFNYALYELEVSMESRIISKRSLLKSTAIISVLGLTYSLSKNAFAETTPPYDFGHYFLRTQSDWFWRVRTIAQGSRIKRSRPLSAWIEYSESQGTLDEDSVTTSDKFTIQKFSDGLVYPDNESNENGANIQIVSKKSLSEFADDSERFEYINSELVSDDDYAVQATYTDVGTLHLTNGESYPVKVKIRMKINQAQRSNFSSDRPNISLYNQWKYGYLYGSGIGGLDVYYEFLNANTNEPIVFPENETVWYSQGSIGSDEIVTLFSDTAFAPDRVEYIFRTDKYFINEGLLKLDPSDIGEEVILDLPSRGKYGEVGIISPTQYNTIWLIFEKHKEDGSITITGKENQQGYSDKSYTRGDWTYPLSAGGVQARIQDIPNSNGAVGVLAKSNLTDENDGEIHWYTPKFLPIGMMTIDPPTEEDLSTKTIGTPSAEITKLKYDIPINVWGRDCFNGLFIFAYHLKDWIPQLNGYNIAIYQGDKLIVGPDYTPRIYLAEALKIKGDGRPLTIYISKDAEPTYGGDGEYEEPPNITVEEFETALMALPPTISSRIRRSVEVTKWAEPPVATGKVQLHKQAT